MAATIVAGFTLNFALGRSTVSVPPIYHLHGAVFMAWVALYVAQNVSMDARRVVLHRRMGKLSYALIPVMVVLGGALIVASLRRTGGPFFFDQNQFLVSNLLQLLLFAVLAVAGLAMRRHTGWHRRLLFGSMAILTGPGLGRILPLPLAMPHAWHVAVFVPLVWPIIGMLYDRRRSGAVHPAWVWVVGSIVATQVVADFLAYSSWGIDATRAMLEGSPGAERPIAAFVPPGFGL